MNIENMLLQMLFGAMAGYITNDLALEMLFEKRFGLGGVIPRTKQQFVANISELVERDIITDAIISKEMEKPEFDRAINHAARDFFDVAMPEQIGHISLADAPGFDQMAENIASYADRKLDVIAGQVITALEGQLKPEQIIGEEQLSFALSRMFDELLQATEKKPIIEEWVIESAKTIKENHLESILDWLMALADENREELGQMVGRAMTSGLAKMGPMMAMLAGGLSFMTGSIQEQAVDFIANREVIKRFLEDKLNGIEKGDSTIPGEIKNATITLLQEKRNEILTKVQQSAGQTIKAMSMRGMAESFLDTRILQSVVRPETIKTLAKQVNLHETYVRFIESSATAERMKENAAEGTVRYIKQNANQMLTGKVRQFVENNLNRYNEHEVKEIARDFIGRNLKPITYFGGFLGMITGFFLSWAMPAGNAGSLVATLIYMATYGVMGWATNWIAITMLFRPYQKYAIIPLFSPGYIIKNKAAFGKSLGRFIETEVLSGKIISQWFSAKKGMVKEIILQRMTEGGHETIRSLLTENGDTIAASIAAWEMNWLHENKEKTAGQIAALINNLAIKDLIHTREKQIAEALYHEWNSDQNAAAVAEATEAVLDKIVQHLFDELDKPENTGKMADYLCEHVELLNNIPFVPQAMVRQILVNVIESFVTEELPVFWSSKSTQVRKDMLGVIDAKTIEQAVVYGKNNLHKQKMGDYLLDGLLRQSLAGQIKNLADSEVFLQSEIRSGSMILADLAADETFMVGDELLQYGLNMLADAMTDTMEQSIGGLLQSVSFAQVAREQVEKLDGRQIHKMFDSFMHKYFVSIRRYGFIGAAFGIHTVIGFALMGLYWLWCLIRRTKSKFFQKNQS